MLDSIPDTQAEHDGRGIAVERAGIADYALPLEIVDIDGHICPTIARIEASSYVEATARGTHMSRFITALEGLGGRLEIRSLGEFVMQINRALHAGETTLSIEFPWFVRKKAPRSGISALLEMQAGVRVSASSISVVRAQQTMVVPVTSLCPCSRSISRYGAHNQRCLIVIRAICARPVPYSSLIDAAERSASCEIFPALKREDEKFVTERAYENPRFAEDIARETAIALSRIDGIAEFAVTGESLESIHNHSAVARVTSEPFSGTPPRHLG